MPALDVIKVLPVSDITGTWASTYSFIDETEANLNTGDYAEAPGIAGEAAHGLANPTASLRAGRVARSMRARIAQYAETFGGASSQVWAAKTSTLGDPTAQTLAIGAGAQWRYGSYFTVDSTWFATWAIRLRKTAADGSSPYTRVYAAYLELEVTYENPISAVA
jgi:hypothetical protein